MQEALEGRGPLSPELRELAAVAALARELRPAGPDEAAAARLAEAFEERLAGRPAAGWWRFLAPWLGAGPAPRPLVERVAAGALVLGLIGGGGGAATGHGPLEMAEGAVQFVQSAVRNFDPRDGGDTPGIEVTPSPTPTTTPSPLPTESPSAAETPVPSSTPGANSGATATADHHDDDEHEDESDDDHRGDSHDDSSGRNRGPGGGSDDRVDDHPSGDDD